MDINSQSTTSTVLTQSQPTQLLPAWRLVVPLLCQTAIILGMPAQSFHTQVTGKTIILQTIPVDPYDPLRGYSQTLSYDISRLENLRSLPGWQELIPPTTPKSTNGEPEFIPPGSIAYIILEAPTVTSNPPKAWKPVRVSASLPKSLAVNQIALKGKSTGYSIEYGLETYYMPEAQRDQINQNISQAQAGRQKQAFVVEAKVDGQGHSVPISLWVRDRNYRF
ncbi:MAG TPA: GDYXXLXY domain-containing protein [Candidatus Sericytochromatia bacterium]